MRLLKIKIVRNILLLLALVVLIVIVLIFLASFYVQTSHFRSKIEQLVFEKKHRTLMIRGGLELIWWPNFLIDVKDASLSEYENNETFIHIGTLRVPLAWGPLLREGHIALGDIVLSDSVIQLLQRADGHWNFEDLLTTQSKEPSALQLDISGIKMQRTLLHWRDEYSKQSKKEPNVTRDYRIDLSIAPLKLRGAQELLQLGKLELHAQELILIGSKQIADVELSISAPTVEIQHGKLTSASLTLDWQQLIGEKQAKNSAWVRFDDLRVSKDQGLQNAGVHGEARFGDGQIIWGAQFSIDPTFQRISLRDIQGQVEIDLPQLPIRRLQLPLQGSLNADLGLGTARIHLNTQIDDGPIQLQCAVTRLNPLTAKANLDIARLKLDPFLPQQKISNEVAAETFSAPPSKPFDLGGLDKSISLTAMLHIGFFEVGEVQAKNVVMKFSTKQGALGLDKVSKKNISWISTPLKLSSTISGSIPEIVPQKNQGSHSDAAQVHTSKFEAHKLAL